MLCTERLRRAHTRAIADALPAARMRCTTKERRDRTGAAPRVHLQNTRSTSHNKRGRAGYASSNGRCPAITRDAKYPAHAKVPPDATAPVRVIPARLQYRYVKIADSAAAIVTPGAYARPMDRVKAISGASESTGSFCIFAAKGIPITSWGYQLGSECRLPKSASLANWIRRMCNS